MNIMFTDYCNQKCSYCFASGQLYSGRSGKGSVISLQDLGIVLDFLKRNGELTVGVLGGEPTLHPEFTAAIGRIIDRGMSFLLFSNGIINSEKTLSFLREIEPEICSILINVNPPNSYKSGVYALLLNTLKALREKVTVGFNICEENFDPRFLLEYINNYKLRRLIRIGIASPIVGHQNRYLPLASHRKVCGKIVRFAAECHKSKISLAFDCGFMYCAFTERQREKLRDYNSPLRIQCDAALDVSPGLNVSRCFATSALWSRRLGDFKDLADAERFYQNKFAVFRKAGAIGKCVRCEHLQQKSCFGGCLAHTIKSFKYWEDPNAG